MAFGEKPRLTLEDYDRFFHLPEDRSFTLDQLQQVMLMHGFVKLKTKLAIVAGMKTVDMMPPTRSTLRDRSTYSGAAISLEEIRADIAALDWQECPVGSLATVGPGTGSPPPPSSAAANEPPVAGAVANLSPAVALATAVSSNRRRRRKKKRLAEAASSPAAAYEAAATPGAAQATAGTATDTGTGRKRRRKRRASVQLSGYVLN